MTVFEYIGQGFGIIAVIIGLITYQLKSQRQILIALIFTTIVFSLHYGFLGEWTGMGMNMVGMVRTVAYYFRNQKGSRDQVVPVVFTALMAVAGILTWTAWYSVFVFLGLVINGYCTSFYDSQKVRMSILVTSPLVIVYDAFVQSWGGLAYETMAIISAIIGLTAAYRLKKKGEKKSA